VQGLREDVHNAEWPDNALSDAYCGEAAQLHGLWEGFSATRHAKDPHDDTHQRETLWL